ncbi:hypothetical protein NECAME_18284 [Necator americanus]|uniref:Uncharacterized protein n=1 Tax=Necator americanus TaxID=51031 RepID=W2SY25_NECAM|nr:hypothetical protein NECAME_18284 [Necator americanus]ETN73512.1 hypothetical protein NECAME_18284 [Necator americanus]
MLAGHASSAVRRCFRRPPEGAGMKGRRRRRSRRSSVVVDDSVAIDHTPRGMTVTVSANDNRGYRTGTVPTRQTCETDSFKEKL